MAKRAPAGEGTYNPLDATLAQSVIQGGATASDRRNPKEEKESEEEHHAPRNIRPIAINAAIVEGLLDSGSETARTRSLSREKRVLLTSEEERQVERMVDHVGEKLGTSLKLSHLIRALMAVLCHAEEEILQYAMEFRPLKRPANGDAVALAQFEQALARLISKGLRNAPAIR